MCTKTADDKNEKLTRQGDETSHCTSDQVLRLIWAVLDVLTARF